MKHLPATIFSLALLIAMSGIAVAYDPGDISGPSRDGYVLVVKALIRSDPAMINARDASRGWTPLFHAARKGRLALVEFLADKGAEIDARDSMNATPLFWSTTHREIVEFLISRGADVNARTGYGFTPLHAAAQEARCDVAKLLIEKGADVNARNKYGETPLKIAVTLGRRSMAEFLRSHGAKE